jgi:hypothetical protein
MTGHRLRITLASLCLASLSIGLAGGCSDAQTSTGAHVPFVADAEKQRAEEYKNRGKGVKPGQIPKNVRALATKK